LGEVDKPVVEEPLVNPTASLPPLQACDFSPNSEPSSYPKVIQQNNQPVTHPKDCIKSVKKPTGKKLKGSVDVNFKNKRVGWLISRSLQNKTKSRADLINMIEVSERSYSEIDKFLAQEELVSFGLYPDRPYNYVNNLPPCLKDNPEFIGIQLCDKYDVHMEGSLIRNLVRSNENASQSQCDVCLSWIYRYYTNVPFLQSRVKFLRNQVDMLKNENNRLESIIQGKEKRLKTTGHVIFKNVEAATTIVNSKVS
jgi:hypothetical protein